MDKKTIKKSSGIVLIWGSKVLMQLRDNIPTIDCPNTWSLPGGGKEIGETAKECVIREMKEETEYVLKNPQFFLKIVFPLPNFGLATHYFYAEEYDDKQKIGCFEGQKIEFVEIAEIENLNLADKELIHIVRAGKMYLEATKKLQL